MLEKLEEVKRNIQREIKSITALKDAEQLKIKYLGRKGIIHDFMKLIPSLPAEQRAAIGQRINSLKAEVTHTVEELIKKFSQGWVLMLSMGRKWRRNIITLKP